MQTLIKYARKNKIFKPIVITDIDGVLLRGKTPIPRTEGALKQLENNQIPLTCLTNGGGRLEEVKCQEMNSIFQCPFFSK